MSRRTTFYAGKKPSSGKNILIALGCVALAAALFALAFFGVRAIKNRKQESDASKSAAYGEFEWKAGGFETASQVKCLDELYLVYKDSQTGLKGLTLLDGSSVSNAEYTEFKMCSDAWRSDRLLASKPDSSYLLVVSPVLLGVTQKQYHGATQPTSTPMWNTSVNALSWYDSVGFAGEVLSQELKLTAGLYPVASIAADGGKWGYINENLVLSVALAYDNALDFSEGFAAVKKGGKWGYINAKGETVIPFEYDSLSTLDNSARDVVFSVKNGMVPVMKNGKMGVIDISGKTVVDFEYSIIFQGKDGKYIAQKDEKWGVITLSEGAMPVQSTTVQVTEGEPALAAGTYAVTTSGSVLNMRSSATVESDILYKIPNGTVVTVTKSVSGWAYITYKNSKGWVSAEYLISTQMTTAAATTTAASTASATTSAPVTTAVQ